MKAHNVILTAVGAFTLGAGLALLLAPKNGEDTRALVKKYIKKYLPNCKKDKLEMLADKIEEDITEAKA